MTAEKGKQQHFSFSCFKLPYTKSKLSQLSTVYNTLRIQCTPCNCKTFKINYVLLRDSVKLNYNIKVTLESYSFSIMWFVQSAMAY